MSHELLFNLEEAGIITDVEKLAKKVASLYSNNSNSNSSNQNEYTVEIMTIHKSKGLQFDYVFIPYLDSIPKANDHQILLWQQYHNHDMAGILLAPYYIKKNIQAKFYESLRYIDKQKEVYELSRLLYVAVTRSIKACILSASLNEDVLNPDLDSDSEHVIKANPNSMLSLLLQCTDITEINIAKSPANAESTQELQATSAVLSTFSNSESDNDFNQAAMANRKLRYLDPAQYNLAHVLSDQSSSSIALQKKTKELLIPEIVTDNPKSYLLEDENLRIIGIFVHKIFYNIVKKYLSAQDILSSNNKPLIDGWRNMLLSQGISLDQINHAVDLVLSAIRSTLTDPIGQWILADYEFSLAEHQVYYQHQGNIKSSIIDRVFIDDNTIWIIDYKITNDQADNQDYQLQLAHYKYLISKLYADQIKKQGLIIKTYLYYPLLENNRFISTEQNSFFVDNTVENH